MRFAQMAFFLIFPFLLNNFLYAMKLKNNLSVTSLRALELREAILAQDCQYARKILARISDVNFRYTNGITPLLYAIYFDNLQIVKCLYAHGADFNLADSDGRTPLLCAALWGRSELVEYLIDHGSGRLVCDRWGRIPWAAAVRNGDAALVGRLMREDHPCAYAMIYTAMRTTMQNQSTDIV